MLSGIAAIIAALRSGKTSAKVEQLTDATNNVHAATLHTNEAVDLLVLNGKDNLPVVEDHGRE